MITSLNQRPITAVRKRGQLIIPNRGKGGGPDIWQPTWQLFLVPGSDGANAGYTVSTIGDLTPTTIAGVPIVRLKSFGANWCMLDIASVGDTTIWQGNPEVFISFPGKGTSGILSSTQTSNSYSYGGQVTDLQADLVSEIGKSVEVLLTISKDPR